MLERILAPVVVLIAIAATLRAATPADTITRSRVTTTTASPADTTTRSRATTTTASPADDGPDDPALAGRFSGRVFGPDGKPLRGARVFIVPTHDERPDAAPVRALTDDDGSFTFDAPDLTYADFDGLPARREGLLWATSDGYALDWRRTWGHATGSGLGTHRHPVKGANVNLRPARDDVPLRGRFLDADGRPLAGARVGLVGLMIPRGNDLDAHLDHERRRLPITLVHYEREMDPANIPGLTTETRTDADGRFTFRGLGRDRLVTLRIAAPTVIDTEIIAMTREAPDVLILPDFDGKPTQTIHGAGFTVRLPRGLTVRGTVRDRDTKAPIAGMWVTKYWNPLTYPSYAADAAVTDEHGRFTISGLDPQLLEMEQRHRELTAIPRPGGQHLMAKGFFERDGKAVIECARGIPFRLKVVDERGLPVETTVEWRPIDPNPHIEELIRPLQRSNWPIMNRAAWRADGTYEGFVLPGPGAVVVAMPRGGGYQPAHVDPKAFFAPGRVVWPDEASNFYRSHNTLSVAGGWLDQCDTRPSCWSTRQRMPSRLN